MQRELLVNTDTERLKGTAQIIKPIQPERRDLVMHDFGGKIPSDPATLRSFYGIGRKVLMLIYQDAFKDRAPMHGIVCDTHVHNTANWTKMRSHDTAAKDIESWLNPQFCEPINEVTGGPRQLWANRKNHEQMKEIEEANGHAKDPDDVVINVRLTVRMSTGWSRRRDRVAAHTGDTVPGLEHDAAGPGMEVHQIGEAECLVRSHCLADTGPPGAFRPPFIFAFRLSAGKNRYGWIP